MGYTLSPGPGSMPDEFPSFLMVQTTTRCNAACIFCPYPVVSKEIPRREMSFTLFRKLMNECSRHPRLGGIMLYLMNEPLTDPQLVDRIDYAKQRNPETPIIICTNGCNLDRVTVDGLLGSGLDLVDTQEAEARAVADAPSPCGAAP